MKISVCIPHVPLNNEVDLMLKSCIDSLPKTYGELIILYNHAIGYGKAFNRLFEMTKGDYIIAVSNDTRLISGTLAMMCDPEAVTFSENSQWGCFFCLPRWVYEQVGGFDERFEGAYFEDDNYLSRLRRANIPVKRVPGVIVEHKGGVTVKAMNKESEFASRNSPIFGVIEKELDDGASLYVPPCGNACKDKSDCLYHSGGRSH